MSEPYDPSMPPPPPPPYGAPPPPYGAPQGYPPPPPAYNPQYGQQYGQQYGPPPGQRINDPAPMGMRLLARIIDGLLTGVVAVALTYAFGMHVFSTTTTADGTTEASFHLYNTDYFKYMLIVLIVSGLYEVPMLMKKGATLGKLAVGVRVARLADGQNPDLNAAVIRWSIPAVASAVFFLLGTLMQLSPFFDSTHRNRGWYDNAAKTIAVRSK